MRYKYFVLCFSILILSLYLLIKDSNICQAQAQKAQTEVSANFLSNFGDLLDDFNDGNSINNWGYLTYYGSGSGGSGNVSYVNGGYEGKCLKLDYNVQAANSFFWYCSKLGDENLNSYNGLTFYVRGENGGEYFKVELKTKAIANQGGRSNAHLYITDYLDGGVTTNWQKVVIPFKNFANITNFNYMKELTIVFEEHQSGVNGSSKTGTVYIDNIKFTNVAGGFDVIRIDHYGDKVGICALGGQVNCCKSGTGDGSFIYTDVDGEYHNSKNGLKITYQNIPCGGGNNWFSVYHIFGGGADGWQKCKCDFSDYNYIKFWVKGGSNRPKQLQVVLKDSDGDGYYGYTSESTGGNNPDITTSWQQFTFPLSNVENNSDVDLNKLVEISFTINEWCTCSPGSSTGTVYIDEVQFEK